MCGFITGEYVFRINYFLFLLKYQTLLEKFLFGCLKDAWWFFVGLGFDCFGFKSFSIVVGLIIKGKLKGIDYAVRIFKSMVLVVIEGSFGMRFVGLGFSIIRV